MERGGVGPRPGHPLPTQLVRGRVAVDQVPEEPPGAPPPVEVQVLHQEAGRHHADPVVHPPLGQQLAHAGVDQRIAGTARGPRGEPLTGPGAVVGAQVVTEPGQGTGGGVGPVAEHVGAELPPGQLGPEPLRAGARPRPQSGQDGAGVDAPEPKVGGEPRGPGCPREVPVGGVDVQGAGQKSVEEVPGRRRPGHGELRRRPEGQSLPPRRQPGPGRVGRLLLEDPRIDVAVQGHHVHQARPGHRVRGRERPPVTEPGPVEGREHLVAPARPGAQGPGGDGIGGADGPQSPSVVGQGPGHGQVPRPPGGPGVGRDHHLGRPGLGGHGRDHPSGVAPAQHQTTPEVPVEGPERPGQKPSTVGPGPGHQGVVDHEEGDDRTVAGRRGQGRVVVRAQVAPEPHDRRRSGHRVRPPDQSPSRATIRPDRTAPVSRS